MCYNGCSYERFNPATGDCHCRLPAGCKCPQDIEYCSVCDDEIPDIQVEESSKYNQQLCKDCLEDLIESLKIICEHCGEAFEINHKGRCPKCQHEYDSEDYDG